MCGLRVRSFNDDVAIYEEKLAVDLHIRKGSTHDLAVEAQTFTAVGNPAERAMDLAVFGYELIDDIGVLLVLVLGDKALDDNFLLLSVWRIVFTMGPPLDVARTRAHVAYDQLPFSLPILVPVVIRKRTVASQNAGPSVIRGDTRVVRFRKLGSGILLLPQMDRKPRNVTEVLSTL